ncbi:SigB/SigF/SigG family RNA polymerase sigma factor [Plantactinospora sp. WMMC1484]|uniref:SigB/SigF/SigG family RNA polymerase sigma factor n=1 Tax=Plantactinospora sp. WMMC1484 TaxID=3404122 RepID=UPI003BF60DBF
MTTAVTPHTATTTATRPTAPRPDRFDATERARTEATIDHLLHRMCTEPAGTVARARLREQVITLSLPIAHRLVRRYRNHGEPLEDLRQVAALALVNAVDRYDPAVGEHFLGFAIPTILGEVKRHFRDCTWMVHVPRRFQELRRRIAAASDALAQRLHRSPTLAELADHLAVAEEELIDGLYAATCHDALSLDGPGVRTELLLDGVGDDDPSYRRAEARLVVHPALCTLPERERTIMYLRFFENLSQTQIAARVGMSQMHVSRLIRQSLDQLREHLSADPDTEPDPDTDTEPGAGTRPEPATSFGASSGTA